MRVAFVTDSLVEFGGADRMLQTLLKIFPDADVFTSVFNSEKYEWLREEDVKTSFIQKLPFQSFFQKHYTPLSPLAFEQFDFSSYDLVISLSAGCSKGIVTPTHCLHVGIILTPPRYLWGFDSNGNSSILSQGISHFQKLWDQDAGMRPDFLISISKFIQQRVSKIYGRESELLYPGVNVNYWKSGTTKREKHYLIVSRLHGYKRIDLAIEACKKLKKKLVIIGDGPVLSYLKSIADSSVNFLGFLPDDEVREHMRKCRAFIFPGVEDFGIAPLEAMACGCPIIAYNKGGVAETVENGVTGVLFEEQTVTSLRDAIKSFEKSDYDQEKIVSRAAEFSENRFVEKFKSFLERIQNESE